MSEDIKELVKRLRAEEWATVEREQTRNAAADALEAMAGEVERLTVAAKAADMFHAINGHGIKRAEELADHIIRQMLWGMRIDDSNKGIVRGYLLDHFKAVISRAEAAEAERDRLAGEVETLQMKLAACGAGALANTERTVAQRITKESPYWSASLGDVYHIVDKEMEARAERDRLKAALAVPEVWTEEERDGMAAAWREAGQKHGMYETIFAVAAWLLRHRARKALGGDE